MSSPDLRKSTAWPLWLSALVFVVVASVLALVIALGKTWRPFTVAVILIGLLPPALTVYIQRGSRPRFSLTTMFL